MIGSGGTECEVGISLILLQYSLDVRCGLVWWFSALLGVLEALSILRYQVIHLKGILNWNSRRISNRNRHSFGEPSCNNKVVHKLLPGSI